MCFVGWVEPVEDSCLGGLCLERQYLAANGRAVRRYLVTDSDFGSEFPAHRILRVRSSPVEDY